MKMFNSVICAELLNKSKITRGYMSTVEGASKGAALTFIQSFAEICLSSLPNVSDFFQLFQATLTGSSLV